MTRIQYKLLANIQNRLWLISEILDIVILADVKIKNYHKKLVIWLMTSKHNNFFLFMFIKFHKNNYASLNRI